MWEHKSWTAWTSIRASAQGSPAHMGSAPLVRLRLTWQRRTAGTWGHESWTMFTHFGAHLAHAGWAVLGDSAGRACSMIGCRLSCVHGLCPLRWTLSNVAA